MQSWDRGSVIVVGRISKVQEVRGIKDGIQHLNRREWGIELRYLKVDILE